jgi:general stress protein YciG
MAGTTEGGKKAVETLKKRDPDALRLRGKLGAAARFSKSPEEITEIAKKAAATRKKNNPESFKVMGRLGGLRSKKNK